MGKAKEERSVRMEEEEYDLSPGDLESIEDDLKPKGLCGLSNMGNTCYMNAALQSLSNCTPLTQFFLKCDSFIKANEGGKTSVSSEYCKLMKNIWGLERKRYLSPIGLSRSIRLVYAQFRGYAQQDSQEFLRCIMDRLHFELKRPVAEFPSKQNQTHHKKNFIKHESKKLLGGNGSSDVEQLMDVNNDSENEFDDGNSSHPEKQKSNEKTVVTYHSIITDVFNGKLKSSVQCLACNRISTTIENFQDLSLPIPGKDDLYRIHSQRLPPTAPYSPTFYGQELLNNIYNWIESWFIGLQVSLQDCLAAFFAKDELKGDNMYNCEKCNKLRNGVKFLKVLSLPEVLCIHLKRFRHEMYYSSKISSYVSFPVNGLDLKPFIDKDCDSKFTTYDLCAVITHFGNVGGGHYVAYAKNCINNKWYEYNDSMVSEVSEHHVENAEAYVLFYNKRSSYEQKFRAYIREHLKNSNAATSFNGVCISKEWLTRFETCVEPGQISNYDFLCRHGDVPPSLMLRAKNFVSYIPVDIWNSLHSKFGGGPEVNKLVACKICEELKKRREHEFNKFNKLHEEFQKDPDPELSYCLSIAWYERWNAFTKGDDMEPPGPIDNSAFLEKKGNTHVIIEDSDYGLVSFETWTFLHSKYGGGPEHKIVRKSTPVTSNNATAEEKMDTA